MNESAWKDYYAPRRLPRWLSLKPAGREELRRYVRSLGEREHGCLIYENQDRLWELAVDFLTEGIKQGYLGVFLTVGEGVTEARETLARRGLDLDKHTREGALLLVDGDEVYGSRETPDVEAFLRFIQASVQKAVQGGKRGLRLTGNLDSHFGRKGLAVQMYALQNALHRQPISQCSALCTFDVSQIPKSGRPFALQELLGHMRRISEHGPQVVDAHAFAILALGDGGAVAQLPQPS